jgi:hypothetical protein
MQGRDYAVIHDGFSDAEFLTKKLDIHRSRNVFLAQSTGYLYRDKFKDFDNKVLIQDGFEKRRNKDHPVEELFSDLHLTYRKREQMTAFGDYLIVGDDYSESGGPAYAVAVHLTYVDPERDGQMFVRHFVSKRTDTPVDPGGKFFEALTDLVNWVQGAGSQKVARTQAIYEFLALHQASHYPGLGSVKKLSMQHHLETIAGILQ